MKTHWIPPTDRRRSPTPLSLLDEPLTRVYSGKCWYFSRPLDPDQIVSGLEGALRTLPILAGRLRASGEGRHGVRFDLGNGARIDIIDDDTAPRWPEAGSSRRSVRGLMPSLFQTPVDRDVPLLWARVTRFADGKSTLGVVYSHALLDGGGSAWLGEAWASACQGRPLPEADDPRACLDDLGAIGSSSNLFVTLPLPVLRWKQLRLAAGAMRARSTLLAFRRHDLEEAAEDVRRRRGEFVSPLDALTAAVGVTVQGGGPSVLAVIVDMRRRLERTFPNGYVGNLCISPTTAADPNGGFDAYARAVRACIDQATPGEVAAELGARRGERASHTWPRSLDAFVEDGLVQDSWMNPINYQLDFGQGTAEWIDLPNWLPNGTLLLLPDPNPDPGPGERIFAIASLDRKRTRTLRRAAGLGSPLDGGTCLLRTASERRTS